MLLGRAFCALLALVNVSATQTNIVASEHPEIVRVDCDGSRGSAFRVGPNTLLSVAHVTSNKGCSIDGEPINVIQTQGDFSILTTSKIATRWLKVDCNGFVKGQRYHAVGFARGLNTQTSIDLKATGEIIAADKSKAWLWGIFTVVPGMSGGPVTDAETGAVVGTINSYLAASGDSGSVELRSTSVCRRSGIGAE